MESRGGGSLTMPPGSGGASSSTSCGPSGSGNTTGRRQPRPCQRPPSEPQLMVLNLLYLSRLPEAGWFEKPASYALSAHMGLDARNDPPPKPGRHSTRSVRAAPPQAVCPEEEALRQHIAQSIDSMAAASSTETADEATAALQGKQEKAPVSRLECRFNARLAIKLSEVGPGPASGGPPYFRVDVWAERSTLMGRDVARELFARVFVPLNDPRWQRRPCTWPAVNAMHKEVAYLTCEFAFVHTPGPAQGLQATAVASQEIGLVWQPPQCDRAAPVQGYYLEACALCRASQRGPLPGDPAPNWQPIGDLEACPAPSAVARNLIGDTRYLFRVRAVNEAGVGELAEVEAFTAPFAPGVCGQPRLAGCAGPVLSVEWDPPVDDGGAPVVAYRIWVRPYSAVKMVEDESWFEIGHVKHQKAGVQRAEIHTEDLSPEVGRYLCSVAAVNASGEVGPATPDTTALPFPNPCATSAAGRQALATYPDLQVPGNLAMMTYMPPGSTRPVRVPILSDEPRIVEGGEITLMDQRPMDVNRHAAPPIPPPPELEWAKHPCVEELVNLDVAEPVTAPASGPKWSTAKVHLDASPRSRPVPEGPVLDGAESVRAASPIFLDPMQHPCAAGTMPAMSANGGLDVVSRPAPGYIQTDNGNMHRLPCDGAVGPPPPPPPPPPPCDFDLPCRETPDMQGNDQQDLMRQHLQEKRVMLESSLRRYKQVAGQLSNAPEDRLLRQTHEAAEIEAAGYQAEVAVLTQHLSDMERAECGLKQSEDNGVILPAFSYVKQS